MKFCHNFSAPPETIEFFDEGAVGPDFPSGSVDMELKKGEEQTYNVTCKASNSRPAPEITWYMGDDEVLLMIQHVSTLYKCISKSCLGACIK